MPLARLHRRRCSALFALACLAAGSASAQPAPFEVSGGYQFLTDINDDGDLTLYKNGLFASAAWNVTDRIALVGEFTQAATVIEVGERARFAPTDRTIYTTMGGVRYRLGGLFVQALLGQLAVRTKEEQVFGFLDETTTDNAVQAGVGFDFLEIDRVAGRILVDYRRLLTDTAAFGHQIRVGIGATVGLGPR